MNTSLDSSSSSSHSLLYWSDIIQLIGIPHHQLDLIDTQADLGTNNWYQSNSIVNHLCSLVFGSSTTRNFHSRSISKFKSALVWRLDHCLVYQNQDLHQIWVCEEILIVFGCIFSPKTHCHLCSDQICVLGRNFWKDLVVRHY